MKTQTKTITALTARDRSGVESKKGVKIFEVCLEHEPTHDEIYALQCEAGQWQNLNVLKLYPINTQREKMCGGKFWTLSFAVHEDDWLFWCGFCAGKKWSVLSNSKVDLKKRRQAELANWIVQI